MTGRGPVDPDYLRAWRRHTHRSPLYAHLIDLTIETPELMGVIRQIRNRPPPNVYLAAIHYLLLSGVGHPLRDFYASIADDPAPVGEVDGPFREFVSLHREDIVRLANTRYTQTNECRRCVALLPGVMQAPFRSFRLVEIGTSAGLNLALDRYRYSYDGLEWGEQSPVLLKAGVRGVGPRLEPIEVLSRTGIDLHVIRRGDQDDRLWLEALIWPEHEERRSRLRAALELSSEIEMNLVEGDVLEMLGGVLASIPGAEPLVVMNSFVLNQLESEGRETVSEIIDDARRLRPIHRVSLEFIDKDDDWARLEVGDGPDLIELGRAHPHGEWVDLDYSAF